MGITNRQTRGLLSGWYRQGLLHLCCHDRAACQREAVDAQRGELLQGPKHDHALGGRHDWAVDLAVADRGMSRNFGTSDKMSLWGPSLSN